MVLASFGLAAGFGDYRAGQNGIFVVSPHGDPRDCWTRLWWYSPHNGPEAHGLGGWQFLADGATPGDGKVDNWFELLDAWYDVTSQGAAGLNGYAW